MKNYIKLKDSIIMRSSNFLEINEFIENYGIDKNIIIKFSSFQEQINVIIPDSDLIKEYSSHKISKQSTVVIYNVRPTNNVLNVQIDELNGKQLKALKEHNAMFFKVKNEEYFKEVENIEIDLEKEITEFEEALKEVIQEQEG